MGCETVSPLHAGMQMCNLHRSCCLYVSVGSQESLIKAGQLGFDSTRAGLGHPILVWQEQPRHRCPVRNIVDVGEMLSDGNATLPICIVPKLN